MISNIFHEDRYNNLWVGTGQSVAVYNRIFDRLANKDGSGFNPFKQQHYMLLNLAIGGQNGGDPTATDFPSLFEVDYVRVYQKK